MKHKKKTWEIEIRNKRAYILIGVELVMFKPFVGNLIPAILNEINIFSSHVFNRNTRFFTWTTQNAHQK